MSVYTILHRYRFIRINSRLLNWVMFFFFLSTDVARFVVAGECTPIFSWLGGDTSV